MPIYIHMDFEVTKRELFAWSNLTFEINSHSTLGNLIMFL